MNSKDFPYAKLWLFFILKVNVMASFKRSYKNKPGIFCYICSEYTIVPNRKQVTRLIKLAYHSYLGSKLGDQVKAWYGMQVIYQVSASVD